MKRVRRLAALAGAIGAVTGPVVGMVVAGPEAAAATAASATQRIAVAAQDQTYLVAAHQGNLAEIEAGRVAQQKAASPVVRRLGAEFVSDHTRMDADVLAVSVKLEVPIPELPSAAQRADLAAVAARSSGAFDTAWLRSQISAHRKALAAGQMELADGSDASVRGLAQRSAVLLQSHLAAVEQALGADTPTSVNAGSGGQAARLPTGTVVAGRALLGLTVVVVLGSAVLFGPRRRRVA